MGADRSRWEDTVATDMNRHRNLTKRWGASQFSASREQSQMLGGIFSVLNSDIFIARFRSCDQNC